MRLLPLLLLAFTTSLMAQTPPASTSPEPTTVKGAFDVKISHAENKPAVQSAQIGRMLLDKAFHGSLEATSQGMMLATQTGVKGSAGYVAMERVTGTLAGRRGSFALMHYGVMNRGTPQLILTVVPDSGTDELTGLSGEMTIEITGGQHFYTFTYRLP